MSKTWLYSDPHFYHNNIVKFTDYDGSPLRDWPDAESMTEDLIQWYNELVNEEDRVYILGDVAFSPRTMRDSVSRLKGRKVLVKGNHDPDKNREMYTELFDDVRALVVKKGFVLSHVPLHPQCLQRWGLNIHGHLHANVITHLVVDMDTNKGRWMPDERYRCVCVEQTNWRPILLDEVLKERGAAV